MTSNPSAPQGASHCPNCNSPLPLNAKFCETCGAKIEALPVCRNCGGPLPAGAKFCENCGAPRSVTVSSASAPAPVTPPGAPVLPSPSGMAAKPPLPKNTLVIAGVIGAVILLTVVFLVVLPMISSSGGTHAVSGSSSGVSTRTTTANYAVRTTTGSTTASSTGSSTTSKTVSSTRQYSPTQTLPAAYDLFFQVDKDAISGDVTVTVTGPSRNVVNDIEVTLHRADGQMISKDIIPSQKMTEVTLAGTRNSERVEVTVQFYSGEEYKVIDKIVEFNRRT